MYVIMSLIFCNCYHTACHSRYLLDVMMNIISPLSPFRNLSSPASYFTALLSQRYSSSPRLDTVPQQLITNCQNLPQVNVLDISVYHSISVTVCGLYWWVFVACVVILGWWRLKENLVTTAVVLVRVFSLLSSCLHQHTQQKWYAYNRSKA